MTSRDFCYWLQGYFEVAEMDQNPEKITLNAKQVELIKRHLSLVFKHEIDPSFGDQQAELNDIHNDHLLCKPPAGTTLVRC